MQPTTRTREHQWRLILALLFATAPTWAASDKVLTEPFWVCADEQGHVTFARALHSGEPSDLEVRTAAALLHTTMAITTKKGLAVPFCQEETVHIRNDEPPANSSP